MQLHPSALLWLIPLFPLIGFCINACVGLRLQRRFGKKANHSIAIGAMVLAWLVAVTCAIQMVGAEPADRFLHQHLWTMFDTGGGFQLNLAFALDPLSMMMVLVITTIGTLIHVYSTGYMAEDPGYWRFFAYLNLFIFAMLLLVMGDNFGIMFFGWEGVGLASYLLISFWYDDIEKAKAGMKAFVVNRVGDFGFLIGLFVLFWGLSGQFGAVPGAMPTLTFHELRDQVVFGGVGQALSQISLWGMPLVMVACLGFFIGATGKSAQLPLYVWLPDAMAGPTPVSALIHAATMVTAGVYMIGRLNFLFALSPGAMTVIAIVAAATALFAATIGFVQNDIKKVLAYSTVSQLGFMFIGVGVGAYWTGLYHLLTHAFFKACLFLGSGAVILGCHHEQDMRKMGGLKKVLPLTERTWFYSCICITAAPIFFLGNGFFSKDEVLWNAFRAGENLLIPGWTIWMVGWLAAAGTAFYMWRAYYMTFSGSYRGEVHGHGHHGHGHHGGPPQDVPRSMSWVLAALAVGSALTILLGLWAPLGHLFHIHALETPLLESWLAPVLPGALTTAARQASPGMAVEWLLIGLSIAVALGGWWVARTLYRDAKSTVPAKLRAAWPRLYTVVLNKYYVDEFYAATVLRAVAWLRVAFDWFDRTIIDGLVNAFALVAKAIAFIDGAIDRFVVDGAVNFIGALTLALGNLLRRLQSGRVENYLYGAMVGALLVIGCTWIFS